MSTQVSNRAYRQFAASGILGRHASRSRLLALCSALVIAFGGLSTARSSPPVLRADAILIVKHERKLYLLRDNYPLRSYRIALGLSPTGAKEHQWDFRTPEGSYIIDFRQEHSHYYKALHVSYPSPPDLKRSSALHLPAGGSIFIHGEPNRPTKPMDYYKTRDWTNGCIALSNEDLQEVWELTAGRTPVEIVP
jgi:murein L,D-transpeptidase YafK